MQTRKRPGDGNEGRAAYGRSGSISPDDRKMSSIDAAFDELEARSDRARERSLDSRARDPQCQAGGILRGRGPQTILVAAARRRGGSVCASRAGRPRSSFGPGGADGRRHPRSVPGRRARAGARVPAASGPGLGRTHPVGNARGSFRLDPGLGSNLADSAHRWP